VPPHVFSIDERRLRYGMFERQGEGIELVDYRSRELPPAFFHGGPLGGPLSKPEALRGEVDELLGHLDEERRAAVDRASLVIPDRWARLVFAETTDLPSSATARDEILRFKLRRLVPFRVEELRVRGLEVAPLRGQTEPRRILLGFAIELLLTQLERGFRAAGVHLGQISSSILSLAETLRAEDESSPPTLLVTVQAEGYSLLYLDRGEPLLFRYKPLEPGLDEGVAEGQVGRELRLTRSFLETHAPAEALGRVVLAADAAQQGAWLSYLDGCLECPVELLDVGALPMAAGITDEATADWPGAMTMLGASMREVA
jgi:hypothetical protein